MIIKKKLFLFLLVFLVLPIVHAVNYGSGNYSQGNYSSAIPGPSIDYMDSETLVCEDSALSYLFNVTYVGGDTLTPLIDPTYPQSPFYIRFSKNHGSTSYEYEIYSGILSKTDVGGVNNISKTYEENVSISDASTPTSQNINITIIEINNDPNITNIGVQTVWLSGENSSFYKQVQVTDIEDGNQSSNNLTFTISILNSSGSQINLFNISQQGIMNFTPNISQLGTYNITVCANDSGIRNPHQNISLCNQNGSNLSSCNNFSLTITQTNRQPNITSYNPSNLTLNIAGTQDLSFNITMSDPDATPLDTYWYVDDVIEQAPSGIGGFSDEFDYNFGCGVSGNHTIKAEITDGDLNDSIQWNLTVSHVSCPISPGGGGGGGGGRAVPKNDTISIDKDTIKIKLPLGGTKKEEILISSIQRTKVSIEISKIEDFIRISEEEFFLNKGESKKITLDFLASEDMTPGIYLGKILIESTTEKKEILVVIEVVSLKELLDVNIEIDEEYLYRFPGQYLIAQIKLVNFGDIGRIDAELEYEIKDVEGELTIVKEKEFRAVETETSFIKKLRIPYSAKPGKYIFYVKASYEEYVASGSKLFEIRKAGFLGTDLNFRNKVVIYIIVLIFFSILAVIIVKTVLIKEKIKGHSKNTKKKH
jgi:hypothetical protein